MAKEEAMLITFRDGSTAECDISSSFFESLVFQAEKGNLKAYLVVKMGGMDYHLNVLDVKRAIVLTNPSTNVDRAQLARLGFSGPLPMTRDDDDDYVTIGGDHAQDTDDP
jgi:hypothetical protein